MSSWILYDERKDDGMRCFFGGGAWIAGGDIWVDWTDRRLEMDVLEGFIGDGGLDDTPSNQLMLPLLKSDSGNWLNDMDRQ
jgi:hypothetical protein